MWRVFMRIWSLLFRHIYFQKVSRLFLSLILAFIIFCVTPIHTIFAQSSSVKIGNYVWNDKNANGIQDSNETGVPDLQVNLYRESDDMLFSSTYTNSSGFYSFSVPAGTYYLVFNLHSSAMNFTIQNSGSDNTVDSDVNSTGITSDFTITSDDLSFDAGIIQSQNTEIYCDIRPLGYPNTYYLNLPKFDPTTGTLTNVEIFDRTYLKYYHGVEMTSGSADHDSSIEYGTDSNIYYPNGLVSNLATTLTFSFTLHYPFDGILDYAGTSGWHTTGDNNNYIHVYKSQNYNYLPISDFISSGSGDTISIKNTQIGHTLINVPGNASQRVETYYSTGICTTYTYSPFYKIGDLVWDDVNKNGLQDSGEPGVSGVTVNLYKNDGTLLKTTTSDSSGKYSFSVNAGMFYIEFIFPSGYSFTIKTVSKSSGVELIDSNADQITGKSEIFSIVNDDNLSIDAGSVQDPIIPNTGFTPNVISKVPFQTPSQQYSNTDLFLEIPSINLNSKIVGVPQNDMGWETTWLGNNVGYLNGTAFPTFPGNTVLTGHYIDQFGNPGIFNKLHTLEVGDFILIHAWDETYYYRIRENKVISFSDIHSMLQTKDNEWITLITCENYDLSKGIYLSRRMIRAELVKIE